MLINIEITVIDKRILEVRSGRAISMANYRAIEKMIKTAIKEY